MAKNSLSHQDTISKLAFPKYWEYTKRRVLSPNLKGKFGKAEHDQKQTFLHEEKVFEEMQIRDFLLSHSWGEEAWGSTAAEEEETLKSTTICFSRATTISKNLSGGKVAKRDVTKGLCPKLGCSERWGLGLGRFGCTNPGTNRSLGIRSNDQNRTRAERTRREVLNRDKTVWEKLPSLPSFVKGSLITTLPGLSSRGRMQRTS